MNPTLENVNRIRELRHIAKTVNHVIILPENYNTVDINKAASELSYIIDIHNRNQ